MGWIGVPLLIGLIVLTLISTHWLPLVGVVVVALVFLGYEYFAKR